MRKFANAALLGATVALVLFTLWALSPWPTADQIELVARLGLMALSLLIAGGGVYIARTPAFPTPLRRAWVYFLLGSLSAVAAAGLWVLNRLMLGENPWPWLADVFNLLVYPLFLFGILALPYAPLKREQRLVLIVDIAIVVLIGGIFLWQILVPGLLDQGLSGLSGVLTVAYPLADLLILAGFVALLQQDVPSVERRVLLAFAGGIGLTVLADTLFAVGQAFGNPVAPAILNLAWLVARWALLVTVVWQINQSRFEEGGPPTFSPLLRTNLIYGGVVLVVALALLALGSLFRTDPLLAGTLLASRSLTLLVLLRQYFVLRENRRLTKALETLAVTDALTGLANRRHFDETLAHEVIRAQRYQRPFSLLLLDVNDFKRLNDQRGHQAGDLVLQSLASLIRAQLRASDFAARYGGDEFVIILPESDSAVARNVAEKLHAAIEGVLAMNNGPTVSIGRAAFQPKMTAAALLELADQDMYRVKAAQTPAPIAY